MKRPWKIRDIRTGRILHSYSTDEAAMDKFIWMFMGDVPSILTEEAKHLELVGPEGTWPITEVAATMTTISRIMDIGRQYVHATPPTR
jgi:hypothetical protein